MLPTATAPTVALTPTLTPMVVAVALRPNPLGPRYSDPHNFYLNPLARTIRVHRSSAFTCCIYIGRAILSTTCTCANASGQVGYSGCGVGMDCCAGGYGVGCECTSGDTSRAGQLGRKLTGSGAGASNAHGSRNYDGCQGDADSSASNGTGDIKCFG